MNVSLKSNKKIEIIFDLIDISWNDKKWTYVTLCIGVCGSALHVLVTIIKMYLTLFDPGELMSPHELLPPHRCTTYSLLSYPLIPADYGIQSKSNPVTQEKSITSSWCKLNLLNFDKFATLIDHTSHRIKRSSHAFYIRDS